MAPTLVTLVLDLYDGSGTPIGQGNAKFTPTVQLTDIADQMAIVQAPVTVAFPQAGLPSTPLIATDAAGPQPSGWGWSVAFTNVPGNPLPFTFMLPAGPAAYVVGSGSAVFTWTPTETLTSLDNGTGVQLAGTVPAGFVAGTTYYVTGAAEDTFGLSATPAGAPITATGAGHGTLTVVQVALSSVTVIQAETATYVPAMPTPGGTAVAGMVPVATGTGPASQWETLTASAVGADPAGAASAAAEASDPLGAATAAQTAAQVYAAGLQPTAGTPLPLTRGGTGQSAASAAALLTALGAMAALAQSAVLTAASVTAVANQVTRVSTAANAVTVTLPSAPAAGTLAAVKLVTLGTGNAVTVNCGGSDVFNQSGGGTSLTLSLQSQGVLLTYASGVWVVLSDDLPLAQLDSRYLQQSQTFPLANNAYQSMYEWIASGQTDSPLPSFGLVAGSQTYSWHTGGETTQGPAMWFGVNPRHLSNWVSSSPHAALGISAFQDAGDTWNPSSGGHGLEFNIAWVSPSGAKGVAPVEVVGADDETRTVTLALRCGDGQFTAHDGSKYVSGITMSDAGGNGYMSAGPFANLAYGAVAAGTQPGIQLTQPIGMTNLPYFYGTSPGTMTTLFTAAGALGTGALSWTVESNNDALTLVWSGGTTMTATHLSYNGAATFVVESLAGGQATSTVSALGTGQGAAFKATSASATAQFVLNGNAATSAQMVWQKNGANTWVMEDSAGSVFYMLNNSGLVQLEMISGNTAGGAYDSASTYWLSKMFCWGSMVVNNGGAALATTATTGYLYIPSVAGQPTGTPAANAGSVPICYDTANDKLWVYRGGAWAGVAI